MTDSGGEVPKGTAKKTRNRSPAYPLFSLEEAIARARGFYTIERFSFVSAESAIKDIGYSPKGSSGMRALAALIHFGLVEEDSKAKGTRRVGLSALGKTVILAPEEKAAERAAALQEAALNPKTYKLLWERYGGKLPSDNALEDDLLRVDGFNPDAVKGFIKDFRATVEFAKLNQAAILIDEGPEKNVTKQEQRGDGGQKVPPPIKERHMPPVEVAEAQAFDLPLPLISGGMATLRMPRPISGEDYDHMVAILEANLKALRKALVRDPEPEGEG